MLLTGDVMLGRGIDQILPHPADPRLYEPQVASATTYVELAEAANGPIPRPVDFSYVWGDALSDIDRQRPDLRIVNLETAITASQRPLPKGINYRMSPQNVACLAAAKIDCCVLANNHVLDWGDAGLIDTVEALRAAGIASAGAGRNRREAAAPAVVPIVGGRALVFGFGSATAGIPPDWAAGDDKPGVNVLGDLSERAIADAASMVDAVRQAGDLVVASIHWGGNWGYAIPDDQRRFAHGLIDIAGFDVVHGHSSHHAKGVEIHRQKPILYGCGDFLNDYEGIAGYESYRDDLGIAYFPTYSRQTRALVDLTLIPFRIWKFRLNRASPDDTAWLRETLTRESIKLGARIIPADGNRLRAFGQ